MPGCRIEADEAELGYRGDVGQARCTLASRHGQGTQRPVLDVADAGGDCAKHHLHMTGDDVLQGRSGALVRHVDDLDLGLCLEQLAGEVRRSPVAAGREVQLARIRASERDQRGERMNRQRWMNHQHVGLRGDQADRSKIPFGIIVDLLVQAGIGGEDAVVRKQQRVAVGWRAGDELRRDIAAGAGPVVDDQWLTENLLHLPGEHACQDVARPAWSKGEGQGDGPGRILGCPHGAGKPEDRRTRSRDATGHARAAAALPASAAVSHALHDQRSSCWTTRLATGAHLAISLAMYCVISSGLMLLASMASRSSLLRTCGSSSMRLTAALSLATMSDGSPAGPDKAYQVNVTRSG